MLLTTFGRDGRDDPVFLKEVLDTLDEVFFVFTPEGEILQWNDRVGEVTGFRDDEIAGMHPVDLVADGEVDLIRRQIAAVLDKGRVRFEAHLRTKEGGEILYEFSGRLLEREDGRFICGTGRDITEHRQYQDQFRLLVQEVEDYAIFMLDPRGNIISWNEGAEKIKGYTREEIVGNHFSVFYPEEDREDGVPGDMLERAMREDRVEMMGWRVRKDGDRFWARVSLTALRDEQGRLRGFGKVTRDLTEERAREQALRESERRYRRLFEQSQEGIGVSTPDGRIVNANSAALEILGYSREELEDIHLPDLYVDPSQRQKAAEIIAQEGVVRNFETRIRRKDGTEIICQLSSTAIRNPDGEIEAFQTFFRDITEQKQAQEALKQSEERYRRLFEESRDAVILTRPGGDILDVNTAAEELFGYTEEEFLRMDADDLYARPEERRERIVPELLASPSSSILEAEMRHKDDSTFLASASVTVHRDREGEPELIQALVRDITQQRRLEEQLVEIQEEERRRIGQELHDGIASQLTGVAMIGETLTQTLKGGGDIQSSDLEELTDLVRDSARQTRLISRGLNPVQVGKEGLPAALKKLAERTKKQSDLTCTCAVEGDLPEVDDQKAAHLYRIAQEAVNNAVKHADAGSVEIHLGSGNGPLELSVVDDGKGLPDSVDNGGEGLGLYTMRYRADLIGGRLEITGRPEHGTTVCCHLPREDA